MRRVMYLLLPNWPIDRLRRLGSARRASRPASATPAEEAPFATVIAAAGRRLLAAVNPAAAAAGLAPGMPLADALSFLPGLATTSGRAGRGCRGAYAGSPNGAAATARGPRRMASDGVKIEITGSAHLWGGEAAARRRSGAAARAPGHRRTDLAIADTLGAAWAVARFAERTAERAANFLRKQPASSRRAKTATALAPLPVEALRLDPAHRRRACAGSGCRRVGELYGDAARCARPPLWRDRWRAGSTRRSAICPSRCRRSARRRAGGCGSALPSRSPTPPISPAPPSG